MTPELLVLLLAVLLHAAQFALYAVGVNRELGPGYTMSARDRPPSREMSTRTARLGRAYDNMTEWLVPFAAVALVIAVADRSTALTAACAWTFLAARILYVPAYALGWRPGRSLIWSVGFLATLAMAISALI